MAGSSNCEKLQHINKKTLQAFWPQGGWYSVVPVQALGQGLLNANHDANNRPNRHRGDEHAGSHFDRGVGSGESHFCRASLGKVPVDRTF